jgi:hypothetical protein
MSRRRISRDDGRNDDYGSKRKRAPPPEILRTEYGNPVHLTFGWARSVQDVLMQGAKDLAQSEKEKRKSDRYICKICRFDSTCDDNKCQRCHRITCDKCIRSCETCNNDICLICSTKNYKQNETRTLCLDCDNIM